MYQLNSELFVIPDHKKFILYIPKLQSATLVNAQVLNLLKDIAKNKDVYEKSDPLIEKLLRAGVLHRKEQDSETMKFEEPSQKFQPSGLSLFLTTDCNMRCIYCYSSGGNSKKIMSWELAKSAIDFIIDNIREQKRKEVSLQFHGGGEITTSFDLLQKCTFYFKSKTRGRKINLSAGVNGAMTPMITDWIACNLNEATISFDGIAEIQNLQRPLQVKGNSFDVVRKNLKRLDARNFSYGIRTTITALGIKQLDDSVEYMCDQFKMKTIQLEPFFQVGRALHNKLTSVDPEEFIYQYRKAKIIANTYGVRLSYSGARFSETTNIFCQACSNSFAVTPEGYVTSCYEVAETNDLRSSLFFYGKYNLEEKKFVLDFSKLNKLKTLRVEDKSGCENCFCKWHCAGDCPAKLALEGSPWETQNNDRCRINQELTKDLIKEYLLDEQTEML